MLALIHDLALKQLKAEVAQYPRMNGYTQLEVVSIQALRSMGTTQNDILDALYERWAAHDAIAVHRVAHPLREPLSSIECFDGYDDYEYSVCDALEALTYELKGGSGIGHLADTVPSEKAAELAARFFALFQAPRAYRGLGWGDPFYAFEQGVVLLDEDRAGCFLIIESD
ncbi:hypothetical protein K7W42_11580 [Deinococcus sp. HMF7604]|uniref:hypothetical protein n=1 Tax=Deinococcus betulae TaxID=2873312 RepID=UPI001CC9A12A|nr:hypothetical protein [Deinococcus betulae]MBZ9751504.1 hypothetical protein [Deinococcus betulae]